MPFRKYTLEDCWGEGNYKEPFISLEDLKDKAEGFLCVACKKELRLFPRTLRHILGTSCGQGLDVYVGDHIPLTEEEYDA